MLPEDFEISLFGPGVGECVVINIGNNVWIIIDSYIDCFSKRPIALEYLEKKGISFDDVKYIIATHWHSDHVKGMSDMLMACKNATFVFSGVFVDSEFHAFIRGLASRDDTGDVLDCKFPDATMEFEKITSIVADQKIRKSQFADADKRLLITESDNSTTELWLLSPSDDAKLNFLKTISAKYTPKPYEPRLNNYLKNVEPNDVCVVVYISIGDYSFMFGADLEESKSMPGWSDIIKSSGRPLTKSIVFKVPHHGSINGHHDGIWSELLHNEPICIMTPYSRSRLPRDTDITRLLTKSSHCYITTKKVSSNTVGDRGSTSKIVKKKKKMKKSISDVFDAECRDFSVVEDAASGRITITKPKIDDNEASLVNGLKLSLYDSAGHLNTNTH